MDIDTIFFFSSRRRHTRYWRDWSSDVCSSDLLRRRVGGQDDGAGDPRDHPVRGEGGRAARRGDPGLSGARPVRPAGRDRKSVVLGKSVDLGGRRIIKKKYLFLIVDGSFSAHFL